MKFLILLSVFLFSTTAFTLRDTPNPSIPVSSGQTPPAQPLSVQPVQPPAQASQSQSPPILYEETPSFVKEKSPVIPEMANQVLGPNVQAESIILPPGQATSNHLVRGFNLDNLDPDMEIVKASQPAQPSPKPMEKLENKAAKADGPKEDKEANRKLNKTHNLIKASYENLKSKGGNLKNRKEIQQYASKVKYFKQALNMYNEELSKAIFQNYRILETVTAEILKIREDLLESDVSAGKTKQSKEHIAYIQNLKGQIEKVRSLIRMLAELKKDQKMWEDSKVLAMTFPRKIVRYFDLNNQVYQVNRWVHITDKNPWNSIQILKREAYYDPTRCAVPLSFAHFKEYQKISGEQSQTMNEIGRLMDHVDDSSVRLKQTFSLKLGSLDTRVDSLISGIKADSANAKKTQHLKHQ